MARRPPAPDATRGSFAALGSEMAPGWLGSDYGYVRWYGQYSKYFPLTNPMPAAFGEAPRRSRYVFATSVRVGLQTALNPSGIVLTDRFFAGGGTTIRGFAQDSVGPQSSGGQPLGARRRGTPRGAVCVLNQHSSNCLPAERDVNWFSAAGQPTGCGPHCNRLGPLRSRKLPITLLNALAPRPVRKPVTCRRADDSTGTSSGAKRVLAPRTTPGGPHFSDNAV